MSRSRNLHQGRCLAGQLAEAAKKAAETALDEAHKRATRSRRADNLLPVLLALLLLAAIAH